MTDTHAQGSAPAVPATRAGGPELATIGRRFAADAIAGLIATVPLLLAVVVALSAEPTYSSDTMYYGDGSSLTQTYSGPSASTLGAVIWLYLAFLVWANAFGLFSWWKTASQGWHPGQLAVGIRVLDEGTLQPIGWGRAFGRHMVYALLNVTIVGPIVNAVVMSNDPRTRGLHDRVGRTLVVRVGSGGGPHSPRKEAAGAGSGFSAASPLQAAAARRTGPAESPPQPTASLATPQPRTTADVPQAGPRPGTPAASSGAPLSRLGVVPSVSAPPPAGTPGDLITGPPGSTPAAPVRAPSKPVPVRTPSAPPRPARPAPPVPGPGVIRAPGPVPERPIPPPVGHTTAVPARPAAEAPTSSGAGPSPVTLLLRLPDGTALPRVSRLVVGRDPAVDPAYGPDALAHALADEERSLSKSHAAFLRGPAGLAVEDLHSTNGVALGRGGEQSVLQPGIVTPLRVGDVVVLGSLTLRVEQL